MFTSKPANQSPPLQKAQATGFGPRLLRVDGLFLIVMGTVGVTMDLLSYLSGAGPFGDTFLRDPLVIGVIEAHGLAILVGAMAWAKAGTGGRALHLQLAAAHLLLGGANTAFFSVFEALGGAAQGIAVTAVHFSLTIANAAAAIRRSDSR